MPVLSESVKQRLQSARLRRFAVAAGLIFALVGVFGFFAVPPLTKSLLERTLSAALQRPVSIDQLRFNPYALSAELAGLTVKAPDGGEQAGFDTLYVNLEAASLLRGGPVLREVRVDGPRVRVTRRQNGEYDIADLIEIWSKPSDGPTPRFSVSNIQIAGGRLEFDDQAMRVTHVVDQLKLVLPFISSLPQQVDVFVEPHFSARINGAPLALQGRAKPFSASHESELSLDLDDVDLRQYLPYLPAGLPFKLKAARLDSELKVLFHQDEQQPATLKIAGQAHLRGVDLARPDGKPLAAWQRLDVTVDDLEPLGGRYAIAGIHLEKFSAGPQLQLAGADLGKIAIEPAKRTVDVGQVVLAGPQLQIIRDRAGQLDLPLPPGGPAAPAAEKPAAPWQVGVDRIEVSAGRVRYEELALPGKSLQLIEDIQARVDNFSTAPNRRATVQLNASVNKRGGIRLGGDLQAQPFATRLDVDVTGFPLMPLQPYFTERLNIVLTGGQLSAKGRLELATPPDGLSGAFTGQATLGDLHAVDKENNADFLRWKSLYIGNIDARLQPFALSIGEMALSDFFARIIVTPQGELNLMQILRQERAAEAKSEPAEKRATPAEPPPIRIGKVALQGGRINFSDYFVKPNYSVNLTRLNGRLSGLSSAAGSVGDMELRGSYGNAAPVEIVARLNPFAARRYLDLKGEIRGVDLTTLTPYAAKYAGYAIDKGKLSLYATYKLDGTALSAENRVFLDQLTFGERVDSPSATSLPVKLAVALLKNSRGEIDINLPISGSLDDPQFSVGGIIGRVIFNLIVKAVSSPFALLGSLFGGGEELSFLPFDAGRARLSPDAVKRLEALAKAMHDRPGLKLEITGRADPDSDRDGLKRAAVERAVKAEKQKELTKKGIESGSVSQIAISPEEYPDYLRRAYKAANFPKPRNVIGLTKDLPPDEMEKLMQANLPVGEEELRQLSIRRAEAAQAWLVEHGKVPMERLFLRQPKVTAEADDKKSPNRVDFSLQ